MYLGTCNYCGEEYQTKKPNTVYCSNECYRASRRTLGGKVDRICVTCGTEFSDYAQNRDKFCSRECYRVFQRKDAKTCKPEHDNFYSTSFWKTTRKEVLERDSGLCVRCGNEGDIVHHIYGREYNQHEYLITICNSCHRLVTVVEQATELINEYGLDYWAQFVGALRQ